LGYLDVLQHAVDIQPPGIGLVVAVLLHREPRVPEENVVVLCGKDRKQGVRWMRVAMALNTRGKVPHTPGWRGEQDCLGLRVESGEKLAHDPQAACA
jgi:hypothetical protein